MKSFRDHQDKAAKRTPAFSKKDSYDRYSTKYIISQNKEKSIPVAAVGSNATSAFLQETQDKLAK